MELNIGHSIISRAISVGLERAVREMLEGDEGLRMILGTGIDIIEVERIRSALTRHGDRFVERVLHPEELAYCRLHRDPGPFVAVRFAAKEVVSKAFGTGIGAELGWHDMEVRRKESGEPYLILHGKGERCSRDAGRRRFTSPWSHHEPRDGDGGARRGGLSGVLACTRAGASRPPIYGSCDEFQGSPWSFSAAIRVRSLRVISC